MDFRSNIPLYLQIILDLQKQIVTGQLSPGGRLPSTREMAQQYQVNPNTVQRVYNEMEATQLTFIRRGIGTFVTEDETRLLQLKQEMAERLIQDLVQEWDDIGLGRKELEDAIALIYKEKENRQIQ